MTDATAQRKTWTVAAQQELRIEVDVGATTTMKVLGNGQAEVFGTELACGQTYPLSGRKIAVYSWSGCTIEVDGPCTHAYVADTTQMTPYINVHSILHERRTLALMNKKSGPRVMVVGAADSGKTSLCKILSAYATRLGSYVTYVDLDVAEGTALIPGTVSAVPMSQPLSMEVGWSMFNPVSMWFGHDQISRNVKLFHRILGQLATAVNLHMEHHVDAKAGGLVVDTGAGLDSGSFDSMKHVINVFSIDTVLVIDNERLYADMKSHFGAEVEMVKLPKSGGVVARSLEYRKAQRDARIRSYFYGADNVLSPYSSTFGWNDVNLYAFEGDVRAPSSALPIGATSMLDPTAPQPVQPSRELTHSVLALSNADEVTELITSNVAGFVVVTEIDFTNFSITIMSPARGKHPKQYYLTGGIKWIE